MNSEVTRRDFLQWGAAVTTVAALRRTSAAQLGPRPGERVLPMDVLVLGGGLPGVLVSRALTAEGYAVGLAEKEALGAICSNSYEGYVQGGHQHIGQPGVARQFSSP